MNPRDFHQLASKLAAGVNAAELRTAVGRAYYAVYNVGVEILTGMGFRINEGPGGHGDVQKRLHNSGDDEIKNVAAQLSTLHSNRRDADYRMYKKNVENEKTVQAIVKQAGEMIQTLDRCCFGSKRPQIIQSIQEWERRVSGIISKG